MKTDELIRQFVDEGAGRPLPQPFLQAAFWTMGIFLYLFIIMLVNGFRPDIAKMLALSGYILELVVLTLVGITATAAAFCLSRPDGYQQPWIKFLPFPLLLLWAVTAFAGSGDELAMSNLWHSVTLVEYHCPVHILLFSTIPGIGIFFLVRMGAVTRYYWAGIMATLSVTVFAYLFMRLLENNDNPAHLIVWHAFPVFVMCLLGMYAGRRALRWD